MESLRGFHLLRIQSRRIFMEMTRDQVETALREGVPFVIKMADGEKYEVADRNRVALGRTNVIIVGDDDMPHILPMLTMTGISYLKKK